MRTAELDVKHESGDSSRDNSCFRRHNFRAEQHSCKAFVWIVGGQGHPFASASERGAWLDETAFLQTVEAGLAGGAPGVALFSAGGMNDVKWKALKKLTEARRA